MSQRPHSSCERVKSQKQHKDHRDSQSFVKDEAKSKFWKHIQITANHTCSNLKNLCPIVSFLLYDYSRQQRQNHS